MIRILFIALVAICVSMPANAQVMVKYSGEDYFKNVSLGFKILDKESGEPIPYASVCLKPHGDTLITHFTLSAEDGKVRIKSIPNGYYDLCVELLGYTSYQKECNITSSNSIPKFIYLSVDAKSLHGASITVLGKAVEYLKDTIVYNASAFHVGTNAMLEDLLKKMPGMQIKDDRVLVNGKPISEITINGRTFFFGDQSMALKNLPARIVERIKVIDKESEGIAQRTALTDKKVMDVELKEEYSHGTFGSLAMEGGAGWENRIDGEAVKGMYNGKAVLCAYDTKDQLTAIIQGDNHSPNKGHTEKAALNYNTSKIKDFNTTLSVIAKNVRGDSKEILYSDYFATDNAKFDRRIGSNVEARFKSLQATIDFEMSKTSKYTFHIIPEVMVSRQRDWNISDVLAPSYHTLFRSKDKNGSVSPSWTVYSSVKNMGKKGRSLNLTFEGSYRDGVIRSDEENTMLSGEGEARYLRFKTFQNGLKIRLRLYYYEPVSSHLKVLADFQSVYNTDKSDRGALNLPEMTSNESYQAYAKVIDKNISEKLALLYTSDKLNLMAGANLSHISRTNMTGIGFQPSITTGAHEWCSKLSPYISIYKDLKQLYFSTQAVNLDAREVSPALFYNGATDITAGNIYLRQPRKYEGVLSYSYYKRGDHRASINLILKAGLAKRSVVYANWFDVEGRRYSFPVNAQGPGANFDLTLSFNQYFGENDAWHYSMYVKGRYDTIVGYQSCSLHQSINVNNFDYSDFISGIYGDENGAEFYSGKSGFAPSRTRILDLYSFLYICHRTKDMTNTLGVYPKYYASFYTLNSNANQGVLALPIMWDFDYTLPFGLYFSNSIAAKMYDGYGRGFDKWVWIWDIKMSKDVGRFTLSLKCEDILNQTISLSHLASAEYYSNSISSVIGRSLSLGVTFNFGKNNEAAQRRANRFVRDLP